jgi:hypothetical protein
MQGMVSVKNLVKTFTSKDETVTALNNVTGAFRMWEDDAS